MDDATLDAIAACAAAATPPPWKHDLDVFNAETFYIEVCVSASGPLLFTSDTGIPNNSADAWQRARETQAAKDAEFIAHSREDIPDLIMEVCRLRAALHEIIEDWEEQIFVDEAGGSVRPGGDAFNAGAAHAYRQAVADVREALGDA